MTYDREVVPVTERRCRCDSWHWCTVGDYDWEAELLDSLLGFYVEYAVLDPIKSTWEVYCRDEPVNVVSWSIPEPYQLTWGKSSQRLNKEVITGFVVEEADGVV